MLSLAACSGWAKEPTPIPRLTAGAHFQGAFFPYVVEATALHPGAVAFQSRSESGESKRWRRVLAAAGGAGGFLAYMPRALSDARVGVSDSERLLEWSAVTAGGAFLGYVIGKRLDRR